MSGWDGNVTLRDNTTGEERTIRAWKGYAEPSDEDEYSYRWNWTGGNFGCDCNRWLEWERARGRVPDIDDAACGEERFSIVAPESWADADRLDKEP